MFPLTLCIWIANETNRYANQIQALKGQDTHWEHATVEDIRVFLGIRIFMSVMDLPSIKMYWAEDTFLGRFAIANVMTRDRFEKLSQYFHVADRTGYNRADPNRDRCHLVRLILTFVHEKCLENYIPHKEVSIDEAMIAFRGQLRFRQYMPAKPTKYGIKVWVRADSTNGYVNEFSVYVGKPPGVNREVALGQKTVLALTAKLNGHHNHIYFDNYFNSPLLHETFLRRGLYGCGTVKSFLKNLPPQMSAKTQKRGVPRTQIETKTWRIKNMAMHQR